jgi:hypothetical protein
MKILFYSVNTLTSTPNFGAELELMHNCIEAGDEVFIIHCQGELLSCHVNQQHWKSTCLTCVAKFQSGIQLLNLPKERFLKIETHFDYSHLPQRFETLQDLINYRLDGIDIGESVASSLTTELKNYKFSMVEHQDKISQKLRMAYAVYRSFSAHLDQTQPDRVYIFNGRLAETRPVVRVCQQRKIPIYIIERVENFGHYSLTKNCLEHELAFIKNEVQELWQKSDLSEAEKEQIGSKWFLDKRNRVVQAFVPFAGNQDIGLLPDNFDPGKKNIGIFISSEYEFSTFPDWKNPLYADQSDGIERLAKSLLVKPLIHLWVRVHPYLIKNPKNAQTQELSALDRLALPNLSFIWPDSRVDTYSLMDACDQVITFGSSVGAEATFWGKPSLLLGHAPYESLDCCYEPASHDDAVMLILANLAPKPKMGALKYGYRVTARGTPYRKFKMKSLQSGDFLGVPLSEKPRGLWRKLHYQAWRKIDKTKNSLAKRVPNKKCFLSLHQ